MCMCCGLLMNVCVCVHESEWLVHICFVHHSPSGRRSRCSKFVCKKMCKSMVSWFLQNSLEPSNKWTGSFPVLFLDWKLSISICVVLAMAFSVITLRIAHFHFIAALDSCCVLVALSEFLLLLLFCEGLDDRIISTHL